MPESAVEIDFFQIEKQNSSPRRSAPERVGPSCRRIQNVVSRINPVLLTTVMAAEAAAQADSIGLWTNGRPFQSSNLSSPSAAPGSNRTLLYPFPVLNPASRSAVHGHPKTAPLTIFYDGTVTTFDVSSDMAEAIIRMAESGIIENPVERSEEPLLDVHQVEEDLPIARRKSLERFLEKRRGRCRAPAEPFSSSSSVSPMSASQSMILQSDRGHHTDK